MGMSLRKEWMHGVFHLSKYSKLKGGGERKVSECVSTPRTRVYKGNENMAGRGGNGKPVRGWRENPLLVALEGGKGGGKPVSGGIPEMSWGIGCLCKKVSER